MCISYILKVVKKCLVMEYVYVIELLVAMPLEINAAINVTYS